MSLQSKLKLQHVCAFTFNYINTLMYYDSNQRFMYLKVCLLCRLLLGCYNLQNLELQGLLSTILCIDCVDLD